MILDEIAEKTRVRVNLKKDELCLQDIRRQAEQINTGSAFAFENALNTGRLEFICEVKKASPSKGIIAGDFPYLSIAKEYEEAGAAAISVLTEPDYFLGSDSYLKEIAATVKIPLLRKDFTIDPYQIYEAKLLGASAILLICALLSEEELTEYRQIADSLQLSSLVEAHDEKEVESAVKSGARIIGVNNRNLKDFTVDIQTSVRLRSLIPQNTIMVSESGIAGKEQIQELIKNKTNAVLIGELLMRSKDKKEMLAMLRGERNE